MWQNIRHQRFLENDGATLNDSLITTPCGLSLAAADLELVR